MRVVVMFVLVLFSLACRADALYCSGKIAQLIVYGAGDLSVLGTWRGDWTYLCNVKAGSPIDTVTCSHWASMATLAFKEGSSVGAYYNVPAGTTCANLATYGNSPVPVYFRLSSPK